MVTWLSLLPDPCLFAIHLIHVHMYFIAEAYEPLGFILVELVSLAESEASGAYEDTQYLLLENNSSENQV